MGKKERHRTGKTKKSDNEEEVIFKTPSQFVFSDSDDDAAANEDLSLKIVEKAMSRAFSDARRGREDAVVVRRSEVGADGDDIVMTELLALESAKKRKKEKKEKKKKVKKSETEAQTVNDVSEGQNTETTKDLEVVKLSEPDGVENPENAVLRRLLRGPRYFDPADSGWGTCYNCGEEGHVAFNCKSARRKKPCFVCGSFEHGAKECQKGKDCFICNKSGHRAKDCPKKFKKCSQGSELCLKCGSSGHDMVSCNNDYSLDDLKEIQCYVCKSFGHLCCANYFGTDPSEMSCYKCGQLGHTGLACRKGHKRETGGEATPSSCFKCGEEGHFARECSKPVKVKRETGGEATPSSCFKCGEEGHFARECSNPVKVKKRSHDVSTPKRKSSKENSYNKGYKSAPQEPRKKKKLQFDEENVASSSKWKPWGSCRNGDHEDFPRGKGGWETSYPPNDNGYDNYRSSGRYDSNYRTPKRFDSPYRMTPDSHSSRNSHYHGYSSPRFGHNHSNGERRRNYDRW